MPEISFPIETEEEGEMFLSLIHSTLLYSYLNFDAFYEWSFRTASQAVKDTASAEGAKLAMIISHAIVHRTTTISAFPDEDPEVPPEMRISAAKDSILQMLSKAFGAENVKIVDLSDYLSTGKPEH